LALSSERRHSTSFSRPDLPSARPIPVAVISITIFRLLSKVGLRNASILENNIVQTAGSAGESIAFGFGATVPAIMILGFDLEIVNVMLVGVLGGLLGILMMIPLRRALIVEQHGILKYPEGTACAEVLKAGADDESLAEAEAAGTAEVSEVKIGAKTIFTGFGIGLVYKSLMSAFKVWKEVPERIFGAPFKGGSISAEISPELLGVGFIIGPYIAGLMVGGGILAYLVLIPAIKFFGDGLGQALAPATVPISQMSPDEGAECLHSLYRCWLSSGGWNHQYGKVTADDLGESEGRLERPPRIEK
jgi:putative OPT family oligopeptide transporter